MKKIILVAALAVVCLAPRVLLAQDIFNVVQKNDVVLRPYLLAISVASLDTSVNWYQDNLGFKIVRRAEAPDHTIKMVNVERDGFQIEIVENTSAISVQQKLPGIDGDLVRGFKKIAFRVDDISRWASELKSKKAVFRYDIRDSASFPGKWFIIEDPDGNWIQFFEIYAAIDYLGQKSPGAISEVFAPGIFSSPEYYPHGTIAFSPDGTEVYWGAVRKGKSMRFTILSRRMENGCWTSPQEAPFLGSYWGLCPVFSPDGKRLYFHSDRPQSLVKKTDAGTTIWYVEKTKEGWSEPRFCPINTGYELSLTVAKNGAIYFASHKDSRKGLQDFDIYRTARTQEGYGQVERLGPSINTGKEEWFPFIAADESYLLFESDRKNDSSKSSLYVSFRKKDGSWDNAIDLSKALNSSGSDRFPCISPDGKYLFFCSTRNGSDGDYYWVDAKIIEDLKPKESKWGE